MSIFEKIKQFFKNLGKDQKLLESANEEKEVQEFTDEIIKEEPKLVNEIEKVDEISEHDKFAKELSDKAKEFNPEIMSKEDAIMKILEEKGLDPEYAKNNNVKYEIFEIVEDILDKNKIYKITKENLDDVKAIIGNDKEAVEESGETEKLIIENRTFDL